ncbi:COG4648 family protein [Roseateles oligotrophus]|uniref:Intracellular septation protein A n=1 Tax=Roseateles oligotrophus TaxID=1769250 RepID=A0ABT2YDF8_9BURK|nr:hypothetical protein [Roseateles oligotrophus]MCV2368072.1 hypothetical protein [Roseateles oligotrophus]
MRSLLVGLLTAAYPLLVYFGLGRFEPRWLALMLAGLALLRAIGSPDRFWRWAAAGALALAGVSALGNAALPLKLYPVLVNTVLLCVFGASLLHPPSAIERLARLREPELDAHGVAYTRRVTQVWCGFFLVNGGIALATGLWASNAQWALYNGLISYLLMGLLLGGEWLVRQRLRHSPRKVS